MIVTRSIMTLSCAFFAAVSWAANDDTARAVSQGNTAFAVGLYERLSAAPGNLFFSPMSVSSALAMTYAGARGETARQMAKTLHFPSDERVLHAGFASLTQELNAASSDYELSIANALWPQKGAVFLDVFKNTVKVNYGAELSPVDFSGATEAARNTINQWVTDKTHGKIANLLKPGSLTKADRLVLTNAIYFNGLWEEPFKKERTKDEPFHLTVDKSVQAPLMHGTRSIGYAENENAQWIELPYKGGTLSMVVLLPKRVEGLSDEERALTSEKLAECVKALRIRKVDVALPRFTITAEFELAKALGAMGMPLAVSEAADFSGMTGAKDLYLSKVVHKAFVDVNEKGTEAAAATGSVMKSLAMRIEPPVPVFRADHPFLFLIRDRRSGGVLFMGRLANPKA